MSETICISCRKPKAKLTCEVCQESLCKNCAQFLDSGTFAFLKTIPEILTHTTYCGACYDEKVAPELDTYQETLERAKNVFVFFSTQKKEVPYIKKARETIRIENCPDRDEMILRIAFLAAQEDYNAIVDVKVDSEKVGEGSYQNYKWSGSGVGAQIDGNKVELQDRRNAVYR